MVTASCMRINALCRKHLALVRIQHICFCMRCLTLWKRRNILGSLVALYSALEEQIHRVAEIRLGPVFPS